MITILFRMMAMPGREADCVKVTKEVMTSSRGEDEGRISYTIYRRRDNPRDFLLFEEWRDQAALDAHLARLHRVYGPADEGAAQPPRRRIPRALLAPFR